MGRIIPTFLAALLVIITATVSFGGAVPIKVEKKEGVGSYLTDSKGMTLYRFAKDSAGVSACSGDCLVKWPVYDNVDVEVPEGLNGADFGILTRDSGIKQTTYKGMPLYYFFKDKAPGDTMGQGVNNVWFIVEP